MNVFSHTYKVFQRRVTHYCVVEIAFMLIKDIICMQYWENNIKIATVINLLWRFLHFCVTQLCKISLCITKEIFLQHFLDILKRTLQNIQKIFKKCFFATLYQFVGHIRMTYIYKYFHIRKVIVQNINIRNTKIS